MLNSLAKPVLQNTECMIPCAMACKYMANRGLLNFLTQDNQLFICQIEKMQPSNICIDIIPAKHFTNIREYVNHSGVGAAVKNDQPLLRIKNQALLMREIILF